MVGFFNEAMFYATERSIRHMAKLNPALRLSERRGIIRVIYDKIGADKTRRNML